MLAYRLAGLLRYAALQFIVLTIIAMALYAGGNWFDPTARRYEVSGNFLSDLGMTHAFSGRANTPSAVLFFISLCSVGLAFIPFAWTWKSFAFARGRARIAGHASAVLGTLAGLSFIGISATPFDLALNLHNGFVVAAFSLLLFYVATITIVMWRNDIDRARLAANLGYLVLVFGYVTLVLAGPSLTSLEGHRTQVLGQKAVVYGSMLHVLYLATTIRRSMAQNAA